MPDEVARQSSAPSSDARRRSNIVTVGLENREYTYPGSAPEKRAAACAALPNTKLEVRNSASLCSLNAERSVPARTARVSKSSGSDMKKPAGPKRSGSRLLALAVFVKRPQAEIKSAR